MASVSDTSKGGTHASGFVPPQISSDDLFAFHNKHFSSQAVKAFSQDFFSPDAHQRHTSKPQDGPSQTDAWQAQTWDEAEEEDDGLGYYYDGVKRTLTDEEIAIFRHSEIEALRREQENCGGSPTNLSRQVESNKRSRSGSGEGPETSITNKPVDDLAANAPNTPHPISQSSQPQGRSKKKKKNNKGGKGKTQEPKPDLRKRTWDVVESGLDTLEYD